MLGNQTFKLVLGYGDRDQLPAFLRQFPVQRRCAVQCVRIEPLSGLHHVGKAMLLVAPHRLLPGRRALSPVQNGYSALKSTLKITTFEGQPDRKSLGLVGLLSGLFGRSHEEYFANAEVRRP